LQTLNSIQTASKQYATGDRPVLVLCSDMHEYVCKHAMGGNGMNLLCEYVAASFLKIWQLPVPDFAFIKLNYEHVRPLNISEHLVSKTCFGSRFNRYAQELTLFTDEPDINKQKAYIDNKDQLLKIALFDLWLANEDRNFNNTNLLIDVRNNYSFVPIDHSAILNSREFYSKVSILTENECLIDTEIFNKLFPKKIFSRTCINELKKYFYLCTLQSKKSFHEILEQIPVDWEQGRQVLEQKINKEIFTPDWEESVIQTFLEYIESPFL
jgi:hypothetical protein